MVVVVCTVAGSAAGDSVVVGCSTGTTNEVMLEGTEPGRSSSLKAFAAGGGDMVGFRRMW